MPFTEIYYFRARIINKHSPFFFLFFLLKMGVYESGHIIYFLCSKTVCIVTITPLPSLLAYVLSSSTCPPLDYRVKAFIYVSSSIINKSKHAKLPKKKKKKSRMGYIESPKLYARKTQVTIANFGAIDRPTLRAIGKTPQSSWPWYRHICG